MRRCSPHPARAVSGLLVLILVAAVGLLGTASPASAHGGLAMSTPAADATVREPLTTVQLYFTEQVAPNAYFTIVAPGGGRVDNGWTNGAPRPLDQPVREYFLVDGKFEPREYTTGFPAVVTVAHLPAVGKYTVSYLSVASDGEPVRGQMSFQYAGPVTPAPQGWSPPTGQPDPALVAAAEEHGHDAGPAQGSSGSSAPASPPVAVPMPAVEGNGPSGWLWAGAVLFGLALVVLVVWRRRPAAVAAILGRLGLPTTTDRRSTARPRAGARAGAGAGAAFAAKKSRPGSSGPATSAKAGEPAAASRWGNTRLALLVGGLVVTLLAGFGLGRLGTGDPAGNNGPQPSSAAGTSSPLMSAGDGHQHAAGAGAHTHPGDGPDQAQATGAWSSMAGFTLRPVQRSQKAGVRAVYRFQIVGPDRKPATTFATVHERPLHMIVVGRDLGGYQHLHPTMAADGTWSVPLELDRPGGYRIYADFSVITADNSTLPLVLGVDHQVPGAYAPAELPPPRPQATAGPYTVTMTGTPTVGVSAPLTFRIGRAGTTGPVAPEPYLGAYGHLVVVREGDLGYVHVHPEPELVDGAVTFWLTAPSADRYRAFFDFQIDGKVHTAQYTIDLT